MEVNNLIRNAVIYIIRETPEFLLVNDLKYMDNKKLEDDKNNLQFIIEYYNYHIPNSEEYILQYLDYLFKHIGYVIDVSKTFNIDASKHDISKFSLFEFEAYLNHFYKDKENKKILETQIQFEYAVLHHIHNNSHHWQYWIALSDDGSRKIFEMPDDYVKEMIADWVGAGFAIYGKNDMQEWYNLNKNKMILHKNTELKINEYIKEVINYGRTMEN